MLADGFRADGYETDRHGRTVARITSADGVDLGVHLARTGLADDRYLDDFRHENPSYARELDAAFAAARAEGAGHWSGCWASDPSPPPEPTPTSDGGATAHAGNTSGGWECHPAYVECLPIVDDLDCGGNDHPIGHSVQLTGNDDPYRLDGNNTHREDGDGCEAYDPWQSGVTYPYYR